MLVNIQLRVHESIEKFQGLYLMVVKKRLKSKILLNEELCKSENYKLAAKT